MAITLALVRPLRFSDGRSAVRFSAYCRKTVFVRDLTGERCSRFSTSNVVHEELVIPPWSADWAHEKYPSSSEGALRLWNDIEIHEEFHNPRPNRICALEFMIALPLELSLDENARLSSTFARKSMTRRGFPFDLIVHDKLGNPHAHIIFTKRPALPDGWGNKHEHVHFARLNKDIRAEFVQTANVFLSRAGESKRLDPRGYTDRGLRLATVNKLGPPPADPSNHVVYSGRLARKEAVLEKNSDLVFSDIEELVKLAGTTTRRVNRQSLAEQARRWIRFPSETDFHAYMQRVENCPSLVPVGSEPGTLEPVFTSRYQIAVEHRLIAAARSLLDPGPPVNGVEIPEPVDRSESGSEPDQVALAIRSVANPGRLVLLSGFSDGERKRIMRKIQSRAASEGTGTVTVNPREGGTVPAAGSLLTERSVSALIYGLRRKPESLPSPFVAVLDDAGLLESWELADLLELMRHAPGKLVLMDDYWRRKPIPARIAFSMLWETFGGIASGTFDHQRSEKVGSLSRSMAAGQPREALATLVSQGMVAFAEDLDSACENIAREFWTGVVPTLAVAPTQPSVDSLNRAIRAEGIRNGRISGLRQLPFEYGNLDFGRGDRVATRDPIPELRVRPGMLGTVVAVNGAEPGSVDVQFDEMESPVGFSGPLAMCLAPGFALDPTRARNQVLDRVMFLATGHVDRNMALTALSRHRSQLRVVIDRSSFASVDELVVCLNRGPLWSLCENERSGHPRLPGRAVQADDRKARSPDVARTSPVSTRKNGTVVEGGSTGFDDHATAGSPPSSLVSDLRRFVLDQGPATASELDSEIAWRTVNPNSVRSSVDEFVNHDETVVLVPGTRECPGLLLTTVERMRLEEAIASTANRIRRRTVKDCLRPETGVSAMGFPGDLADDILSGSALAIVDGPDRSGKTGAACSLARRLSERGPHSVSVVIDEDRAALIRHRLPGNVAMRSPGDFQGLAPADCYVIDAAEAVGAVDMANMLRRAEHDGSAVVMFGNSRSAECRRGSPWLLLTDRFPVRNLFAAVSRFRLGGRNARSRFISEQTALEPVFDAVIPAETRVRGAQSMDSMVRNAAKDFIEDPARGKIVLAATRAQAAAINREVLNEMGDRPDVTGIELSDGSVIRLATGDPVRVVAAEPEAELRRNALAEVVAASTNNVLLDLDPFRKNGTAFGGQRFALLPTEHVVLDHAFADTFENSIDFPGSRHLVFSQASRGQSIRYALSCGGTPSHIHVQDENPRAFLAKMINTTGWTNPAADLATICRDAWKPRLGSLAPHQPNGIGPATGGRRQGPVSELPDGIRVMERSGNEAALNAWVQLTATEMAVDFGFALKEWSARIGEAGPRGDVRPGRIPGGSGRRHGFANCFHGRGNRLVVEAMDSMRAQPSVIGRADGPDRTSAACSRIALTLAVAFTETASPGHVGHKLDIHAKILGMVEKIAWPDGNWFERAIADLHVFETMKGFRKRRIGVGFEGTGGKARTRTPGATGPGTVDAMEIVARLLVAIPRSGSVVENDIVRILETAVEADAVRQPEELIAARLECLDSMTGPQPESPEARFTKARPGFERPLFSSHEIRALLNPGAALPRTLPDLNAESRRQIARNGRISGALTVAMGHHPVSGLAPPTCEGFGW